MVVLVSYFFGTSSLLVPARNNSRDRPIQICLLATAAGFPLHAGVAARANERDKIERLCRYIARPALASSRLSLTREELVRYAFKTPWRDGTTHVLFEPLDFIARLAALIPSKNASSAAVPCRSSPAFWIRT